MDYPISRRIEMSIRFLVHLSIMVFQATHSENRRKKRWGVSENYSVCAVSDIKFLLHHSFRLSIKETIPSH